ncbi:MAG: hypothetical protein A2Y38_17030 [Spirochaetes bacterium GWB1_59_5]|nr:MAG: hypothetical protein A2Y38_17030 [Spirochaetes bacterium GWB1_59_5]
MTGTLECPRCGDVAAEGWVSDGQRITCGCAGIVSVCVEAEPSVIFDETTEEKVYMKDNVKPAEERTPDRTLFGAMEASVMVEIEAGEFFNDEDPAQANWKFCKEHATFSHREACEFILHIGPKHISAGKPYWESFVEDMREYGCTEDFITAYLLAKDLGAMRVMFYC